MVKVWCLINPQWYFESEDMSLFDCIDFLIEKYNIPTRYHRYIKWDIIY